MHIVVICVGRSHTDLVPPNFVRIVNRDAVAKGEVFIGSFRVIRFDLKQRQSGRQLFLSSQDGGLAGLQFAQIIILGLFMPVKPESEKGRGCKHQNGCDAKNRFRFLQSSALPVS